MRRFITVLALLIAHELSSQSADQSRAKEEPNSPLAAKRTLIIQQGHLDRVTSVALSRDGKLLVTGCQDGIARVWETATGREVRRFVGHADAINAVSLSSDGKRLLSGSEDETARLWEVDTGKEIRVFKGHTAYVTAVTLSRDGKWAVSAGGDLGITGTTSVSEHEWEFAARLWSLDRGEKLRVFSHHGTNGVWSLALSPDNKWLVTGSSAREIRVWDVGTGMKVREFKGHSEGVFSLALSRDGRWLTSASYDKTARVWDFARGKEIHVLRGHAGPVHAVALSQDSKWLATGSQDTTARLWDVKTAKEIRIFKGHTDAVTAVAFAGDGRWLITASKDATTRIWEVKTGKELCRLVSFLDGSWLVLDSEGRFDAADPGNVEGLHWVLGMRTFPLQDNRERYYDPGLLAKHLSFHSQAPRTIRTRD
jgi:WD40 repeat protein